MRNERTTQMLQSALERQSGVQSYVFGDLTENFKRRELSCDIEPTGCAFAYLLLFLSIVAHALHHCKTDECDSDDDEPSTMYS